MKDTTKKPASPPENEPEGNVAFERMRELTRRIVNVPKAEMPKPKRKK